MYISVYTYKCIYIYIAVDSENSRGRRLFSKMENGKFFEIFV